MSEYRWFKRCASCGRFVSDSSDYYVPFGTKWSEEPPEPVYLCQKCLDKKIAWYRERGTMPSHYRTADWEEPLAKELGFEWHSGGVYSLGSWQKKLDIDNFTNET